MKNCPKCGSPQGGDALFCDTCGNPFPAEKKVCPLCVAGFIISLASVVSTIMLFCAYGLWSNNTITDALDSDQFVYIIVICLSFILTSYIAGLVISIKGTKRAKKLNLDGKGFGIAGIVISSAMGAIFIVSTIVMTAVVGLAVLLITGIGNSMGNVYKAPAVRYDNYDVYLTDKKDKACVTTWYWSGDLNDTVLALPDETPDGAKITALGDYGVGPNAPRFEIKYTDDIHNYCLTSDYENSKGGSHSSSMEVSYDPTYYGIKPGTEVHYEVLVFTVKLGKYVDQVLLNDIDNYFIVQGDDGIITIYKYYLTFECDSANEKLYAENGYVYNKFSDAAETRQPLPSDTEPTVIVTPDPNDIPEPTLPDISSFGSGPEHIRFFNSIGSDLDSMIMKYIELHPEFGEKYTVDVVYYSTPEDYQQNLEIYLVAGGDTLPDIYTVEASYAAKFTKDYMSRYAATYKELGIDVDTKIKEAEIAPYTVELGKRDGEVVALGYQSTGGVMIYRASIAREVFGTDDPQKIEEIMGAGTGDWTKFFEAAEKLKASGHAIVSGNDDLLYPVFGSAQPGWITGGNLVVDSRGEAYLDYCKKLSDNGWTNNSTMWTADWYKDMKGEESDCFCFFGPSWLINYVIKSSQGNLNGDWRVCAPPSNFYWGGTWFLANKESQHKEAAAELLEWITLDCSETGAQYLIASGALAADNSVKEAVASSKVMAMADGSSDMLGGQNIYPALIQINQSLTAKDANYYDDEISNYWKQCVQNYIEGVYSKDDAIKDFEKKVVDNICF